MQVIFCALLGYLIGNVNPAYLIGLMKGVDIRRKGSGNAGASNVTVTIGKVPGVICAVADIFKGFLAFKMGRWVFPTVVFAGILAGAAAILGHIFPFWMGFRGGKGLASLAGVALAYNWQLFLALLGFELIFGLATNYIALVTASAAIVFPACYAYQTHDLVGSAALFVVAVVIEMKHIGNFTRILNGEEVRISYLWNREAELERLKDVYPDGEDTTL